MHQGWWSRRESALPRPGSQTSSLRKWENKDFCCWSRLDGGTWLGPPARANMSLQGTSMRVTEPSELQISSHSVLTRP